MQFLLGSMLFPALPLVLLFLHQSNVAERYDARVLVALPDVWVFALSFCAAVVMDLVSEPCQTVGQLFFVVTLMVLAAIAASEYGEMMSAFRGGTLNIAYWTLTEVWVVVPAVALAIAAKAFQKERIESTRIRGLWR